MSELALLQREFHAYVLAGDDSMLASVAEDATADAARRLGIYHQAYRLRLAEVLRNDFPGLRHLTGAEDFETMCLAYIEASPSPHFNARWYGDRVAVFLRDTAPWSKTPALAEMAELEWQMTLAFDAVDETLTSLDEVGSVAPEQWPLMKLAFAVSLRRSEFQWNVAAIRLALDLGDEVAPLSPLPVPQSHAVWRADLRVRHRALETDEAAALAAAIGGACFAELCELLCEWHEVDVVAMRAAELLKRWIHDQWVSALLPADDEDDLEEDAA